MMLVLMMITGKRYMVYSMTLSMYSLLILVASWTSQLRYMVVIMISDFL